MGENITFDSDCKTKVRQITLILKIKVTVQKNQQEVTAHLSESFNCTVYSAA